MSWFLEILIFWSNLLKVFENCNNDIKLINGWKKYPKYIFERPID